MNVERYLAAHFAVGPSPEYQQDPYSSWPCHSPGILKPLWQSCPMLFLYASELLKEFLAFYELLYLWSDEDTSFAFYHRQLTEEILKILEGCLSRVVINLISVYIPDVL